MNLTKRLASLGGALATTAALILSMAPTASAGSAYGCTWPGVCFYLNDSDWHNSRPTAVYQEITSSYQNLGSSSRGANAVYNSRNDDRVYLRYTHNGSTKYQCVAPSAGAFFPSGFTVTGIRIDNASSC